MGAVNLFLKRIKRLLNTFPAIEQKLKLWLSERILVMLKTLKYLSQHKHYVGKEGALYEEK